MKQKYIYLAFLLTSILMQTPSAHAQFNTIHEYGNQRNDKIQQTRHEKSCQPTADSVMVDSLYHSKTKETENVGFVNKMMALPLRRIHITSSFGRRTHPITKKSSLHNGVDLRASYEEVYSMLPGIVHKTGEDKRSGKYIIISTGEYKISYCHLSQINVRQGEMVLAGMPVGISGNSGYSTGPHLHLTLRVNGKLHNPETLIRAINLMKNT